MGPLPGCFPMPAAGLGAVGAAAGLGASVVEGGAAFDAEPVWEGLAAPWTRRDGPGECGLSRQDRGRSVLGCVDHVAPVCWA